MIFINFFIFLLLFLFLKTNNEIFLFFKYFDKINESLKLIDNELTSLKNESFEIIPSSIFNTSTILLSNLIFHGLFFSFIVHPIKGKFPKISPLKPIALFIFFLNI